MASTAVRYTPRPIFGPRIRTAYRRGRATADRHPRASGRRARATSHDSGLPEPSAALWM